jgi:hypothetical protein
MHIHSCPFKSEPVFSDLDGDNTQLFHHRDMLTAAKQILGDPRGIGHQHYGYKPIIEAETGERVFGSFQSSLYYETMEASVRAEHGDFVSIVPVFLSSDGTGIKKTQNSHPIYSKIRCLFISIRSHSTSFMSNPHHSRLFIILTHVSTQ